VVANMTEFAAGVACKTGPPSRWFRTKPGALVMEGSAESARSGKTRSTATGEPARRRRAAAD